MNTLKDNTNAIFTHPNNEESLKEKLWDLPKRRKTDRANFKRSNDTMLKAICKDHRETLQDLYVELRKRAVLNGKT